MANRPNILKLATKISLESMTYTGITYNDPEYKILEPIVTDDMCATMMHMRLETPRTVEEIARRSKKSVEFTAASIEALVKAGIVRPRNTPDGVGYYYPIWVPGIMEGKAKPDYKTCVAISTTAALKEMLVPGIMAVVAPLAVGLILGSTALAGLLAGSLVSGVMMAMFMSNAGGAWDNAKKYIEEGHHGGKGSDAHKAAVVGDTVGDPFKDTSGPSINILIKLMTVVSTVFAAIFTANGLF